MADLDFKYRETVNFVLEQGFEYEDPHRKGVKRLQESVLTFDHQFSNGFPILTTKRIPFKQVVVELLWFLRGSSDISFLVENGCNIWNKDALKFYKKVNGSFGKYKVNEVKDNFKELERKLINGELKGVNVGDIYPVKWWNQLPNVVEKMKKTPFSTELIVNSWDYTKLNEVALPPCHYSFQILSLKEDGEVKFDLVWNQRSTDLFLGLPFNIASYGLLAKIIEQLVGYKARSIKALLKNVHLYDNQIGAAKEQIERDVCKYDLPSLKFKSGFFRLIEKYHKGDITIYDFFSGLKVEWFFLAGYESYPAIKGVEMLERTT